VKHILRVVGVALAFLCTADVAMAFVPGVPPASGPGSVFYDNEKVAPTQKSKSKKQSPKKSRSRMHHNSPQ
jgi:hypothetical protein